MHFPLANFYGYSHIPHSVEVTPKIIYEPGQHIRGPRHFGLKQRWDSQEAQVGLSVKEETACFSLQCFDPNMPGQFLPLLSIVLPSEEVTLTANMELGGNPSTSSSWMGASCVTAHEPSKGPWNVPVVWFVQMSNVWTKGSYFSVCNYFCLIATVLFVPGERCEGEVKARVNIKISRQGTGEARQRRFLKCHNSKSIRISWGALKRYLLDSEWWSSAFWQLWNWLERL